MLEATIVESLVTGGPVAILAYIIFHMYRKDRKGSEEQQRKDRVFMEDRLTGLLEQDHKTRESNTKALTELTTMLEVMNGRE